MAPRLLFSAAAAKVDLSQAVLPPEGVRPGRVGLQSLAHRELPPGVAAQGALLGELHAGLPGEYLRPHRVVLPRRHSGRSTPRSATVVPPRSRGPPAPLAAGAQKGASGPNRSSRPPHAARPAPAPGTSVVSSWAPGRRTEISPLLKSTVSASRRTSGGVAGASARTREKVLVPSGGSSFTRKATRASPSRTSLWHGNKLPCSSAMARGASGERSGIGKVTSSSRQVCPRWSLRLKLVIWSMATPGNVLAVTRAPVGSGLALRQPLGPSPPWEEAGRGGCGVFPAQMPEPSPHDWIPWELGAGRAGRALGIAPYGVDAIRIP